MDSEQGVKLPDFIRQLQQIDDNSYSYIDVVIVHPDSGYDYPIIGMRLVGNKLKLFPAGDLEN